MSGPLRNQSGAAMSGPLRMQAVDVGTARWVPGRRLFVALACGLPLFALPHAWSGLGLWWWGLWGAAALWEGRLLARARVSVGRRVPAQLALRQTDTVALVVDSAFAQPLKVELHDQVPSALAPERADGWVRLSPLSRVETSYGLRPVQRGRHQLGDLHLRLGGRLGLCELVAIVAAQQDVRVYPNLQAVHRYALAARTGLLDRALLRRRRPALGGGELEELREYVPGDAYRDVDWKATAKRKRPVVRVHGHDRSQVVMLCIDAGRMMAARLGDHSKFDHALEASLLLAHVALTAGDYVGVLVFAEDVLCFVPPMRGRAHYRRVLDALHDLHARATYVDHARMTEFVRQRVAKRALLLVFSDLVDAGQARPLVQQLARLRRKHLPVCIALEDASLSALAERTPKDEREAFARAAAADLALERALVQAELRGAGIGLVEAPQSGLALAAVDRYLDIKRRREL